MGCCGQGRTGRTGKWKVKTEWKKCSEKKRRFGTLPKVCNLLCEPG